MDDKMQLNKIIISTVCFTVLSSFYSIVCGQTISGKVIDNEQQQIVGATIILRSIDSTYISASVSDSNGEFILNNEPEEYRLVIQHLSYQTKQITGKGRNAGIIQLQPNEHTLDEVVVKGERPLVKVENGKLGYNIKALAEKKVVNNAYEALTKLPSIQESRGALSLAGAGKLTVVLNGKPTTMSAGQLETLLRNTPVSQVEKVEVMYSAPPEYHTRGAVVNVILKQSNDHSFQGEISTHYKNQYFNSGGVNGNFRLSTPKMTFDVMYGADNVKQMEYIDLYSKHTLKDKVYDIRQNEQLRSKYWNHNLRTALDYTVNEKNGISVAYTGSFTPNQRNNSFTVGNFQTSNIDKYIDIRMHNVTLQFNSGFGLTVGGDYTYYVSDNEQNMLAKYQEGRQSSFTMIGGQKIDRYSIYADQKHSLSKGWSLGYGASYRLVNDRDFQTYSKVTGNINPSNTYSNLQEQTTDFYASLSKNFAAGLSMTLSATAEHYSIRDYQKWAIYPQVSLTYSKTPKHTFQLSLTTDKTYPSYWEMQSTVSYLNGYSELWGTPGLKPSASYNLNGSYILKRKYIFNLFFMHALDFFAQTPYQSTERLALIYKNTNWNYMQSWGANAIVPFNVGSRLNSRLTLTGMQVRQRCDDFFDIPFNRNKWAFNAALDNTFKVTRNLAFELMGFVQTPTIQGTFNIELIFNLNAGMKWNFGNEKFSLSVRGNDISNTGMPQANVRFKGQYVDMNSGFYSRTFSMDFMYRFGGYKRKEIKKVDASRFGY